MSCGRGLLLRAAGPRCYNPTAMLKIEKLPLGPILTNCYLVADVESGDCVVIDAAWDAPVIRAAIERNNWNLCGIWLTHAHFDHIGGVAGLMKVNPDLPLALHRQDKPLYDNGGGAKQWGIPMEIGPEPNLWLDEVEQLQLGGHIFDVLFVPGHAPGHVAFYCAERGDLFGGDVLFQMSIGRFDLPGADYNALMNSIRNCFMTLPDETDVYPGHGENTTIGFERRANPFL